MLVKNLFVIIDEKIYNYIYKMKIDKGTYLKRKLSIHKDKLASY